MEDQQAWRELEDRYRELLVRFCCKRGLQHADAEDIVQSVFLSLSKSLPQFVYERCRGRFRDYLYRSVRNAISLWAARVKGDPASLDSRHTESLAAPGTQEDAEAQALWHEEWVGHHYRLALGAMQVVLDARTVEMFDRAVKGESAVDLAAAYGISEQAVYASRRRVRDRIRELIRQQVKDEDDPNGEAAG